ncbi:rRNA-processing protein FCF1 homolog [Littorina saxatilis]|uniref:rRNA-processing protein FCF1 homolog n=1 Tax=Littorina saxatilis TaxID=31220 RepID=A0AAN9BEW6_9CAEN
MGKVKQAQKQKFGAMKRRLNLKDSRLKSKDRLKNKKQKPKKGENLSIRTLPQTPASMFFSYNKSLGPPYRILIDTNFVNFSISNKLDVFENLMTCLYAKCIPYVTDCVMAELEKLGRRYRVALRIVRDPRFERLTCLHKGTYADDCLVERVTQHKCYMVATNDKDLKRRVRKIPGIPIVFIHNHKYEVERLPEAS